MIGEESSDGEIFTPPDILDAASALTRMDPVTLRGFRTELTITGSTIRQKVVGDSRESERVSPERPRRQLVPPPATRRRTLLLPAASPRKSRGRARQASLSERFTDVIVVRPGTAPASSSKANRSLREPVPESTDVIDLGAPQPLRTASGKEPRNARPSPYRSSYIPNPRLYPGPERAKPRAQQKQVDSRAGGEGRGRRRKRAFRRVVPNPRLYTPAPPAARRAPPPAAPRAAWAPPAPAARLDTASRVALRLSERRRGPRPAPPPFPLAPPALCLAPAPAPAYAPPPEYAPPPPLVVTLPPVSAADTHRYAPASAHFQLRSLDTDSGESTPVAGRPPQCAAAPRMDAANRKSTSPEDCSEGNETLSAPSEFLAEFLSAIMRRQYSEALKYCRLILQYEPHNATARGFYPLLQQKVQAQKRSDAECPRGSSSEETSAPAAGLPVRTPQDNRHERMQQGGDSSSESEGEAGGARSCSRSGDSCRSQSSLELDSSEAAGPSSPSLSPSRRTGRSDSASAGAWDSPASASRSDTDDNGNATFGAAAALRAAGDLANDNAPAESASAGASALQRLRAQFTCSIK